MKRLLFLSFGSVMLLTACGSQNLLPLEEQSTELQEKNHELKLENQSLKNENAKKEKQLAGLEKDAKNTKQANTNHKIASYYDASSEYFSTVTSIINAYQSLDKDIVQNKKNKELLGKLDAVIDDHDVAVDQYQDAIAGLDVVKKDDNVKKQHKEVQGVQQKIHKSLETIRKGYANKDATMINKGRHELVSIKVKSDAETDK
ncbi:hypothetical protein [Staphylococcus americanisciuri]|uniref:Lipoprotein n=1 Tax=Staphylococcus americanisciuri TaxID=2973940 RepID=A0ABT2EZ65_9STAP|nr:hypothetical protein [Staphylococcus americanisciuri]MCS4485513.1 hypothetical protein [Staphylococcus americanisciuri]